MKNNFTEDDGIRELTKRYSSLYRIVLDRESQIS